MEDYRDKDDKNKKQRKRRLLASLKKLRSSVPFLGSVHTYNTPTFAHHGHSKRRDRSVSVSRSLYQVQVPKRLFYNVMLIFFVLPLLLFLYHELHLHDHDQLVQQQHQQQQQLHHKPIESTDNDRFFPLNTTTTLANATRTHPHDTLSQKANQQRHNSDDSKHKQTSPTQNTTSHDDESFHHEDDSQTHSQHDQDQDHDTGRVVDETHVMQKALEDDQFETDQHTDGNQQQRHTRLLRTNRTKQVANLISTV